MLRRRSPPIPLHFSLRPLVAEVPLEIAVVMMLAGPLALFECAVRTLLLLGPPFPRKRLGLGNLGGSHVFG